MPKTIKEIQEKWYGTANKYDFEGNRLNTSEKHEAFNNTLIYFESDLLALKEKLDKNVDNCKRIIEEKYHKHFYEPKEYGKWTSSQFNTFCIGLMSALKKENTAVFDSLSQRDLGTEVNKINGADTEKVSRLKTISSSNLPGQSSVDASIEKKDSISSSPSYCHHIWNTSGYCVLCGKKQAVEYK